MSNDNDNDDLSVLKARTPRPEHQRIAQAIRAAFRENECSYPEALAIMAYLAGELHGSALENGIPQPLIEEIVSKNLAIGMRNHMQQQLKRLKPEGNA